MSDPTYPVTPSAVPTNLPSPPVPATTLPAPVSALPHAPPAVVAPNGDGAAAVPVAHSASYPAAGAIVGDGPAGGASAISSPAPSSSTLRRSKPRRVIYKSTNLERTAPELVALASAEAVSAVRAIQSANATAERVRDSYRSKRENTNVVGDAIVGSDEESNAKKYERRLKMNRQSAAASRVRREAYTKALEAELVNMESSYKQLFAMLAKEREERRLLEDELEVGHVNAMDSSAASAPGEDGDEESEVHEVHGGAHSGMPSDTTPSTPMRNTNVTMGDANRRAVDMAPAPARAHTLPPVPPAPSEKAALKMESVEIAAPGSTRTRDRVLGEASTSEASNCEPTVNAGLEDAVGTSGAADVGATTTNEYGDRIAADEPSGLQVSPELASQLLLPDDLPLPECFSADMLALLGGGPNDDMLHFQ